MNLRRFIGPPLKSEDPHSTRGGFAGGQEDIRKKTRETMRYKAEQGLVTGGRTFGHDNLRIAKGHAELRINEAEAVIVRDIYARFASGEGARSIAAR